MSKYTEISNSDGITWDNPENQQTSTKTLEGGVSFADKYIAEPIMKAQDAVWNIPIVGDYLKNDAAKDLPYLMPQTALAVPMKAAEPVFDHIINPMVSRATKPLMDTVNPFISKGYGLARNAVNSVDNSFNNAGSYLMDRLSGINHAKVSSERPIGLNKFNFEPSPINNSQPYNNLGSGITEQAGNKYSPNFKLQGNNLIPANPQLPAVRPNNGIPIGDAFYNYQTARPPQNNPIAGLLEDFRMRNNSQPYNNLGVGKEGIYQDLSSNTGFNLQPNIAGLLTDRGIPQQVNAEEILKNFVQNGERITHENTSFSGNLSPNQVKAYENYFKQVFPKKGQQKLF